MNIKNWTPHFIAIALLLAVAAIFFAPNAFSGKVLPQPDNDKARAMQTEIRAYMDKGEDAPLWTNSAFGGMPSYQILGPDDGNLTRPVYRSIFLWQSYTDIWAQVFAAMLCLYLLLSVLGADWRIALFGALAFGITTYNVDILEAGHSTKMSALALAPGVLAGVVLAFRGRLLLGGAIMAVFLSMQIQANHVQITYYTLIISGLYFLAALVDAIREKSFAPWGKGLLVCVLAIALGFASNLARLWPTYEYSQETIRGKSELSSKQSKGDGLDPDYLFGWSYGIEESLTLLVPHFAGGGAGETYNKTKLYGAIAPQYRNQISGLFYTGDQPFVGTAIYSGILVFFLFLLGAWLVPGRLKYWLLAGGLFMVSLSWGKHFFLNFVWYDYLPMFKKFRAVSMALGAAQLCFAALAALGLQKLIDEDMPYDKKKRAFVWAGGITAGLCLLAFLLGKATGGPQDEAIRQQQDLYQLLQEDRASMLRADVFRSLAFLAAGAGLLWLYLQGKMQAGLAVLLVAGVSLVDNWMVCSRTLSSQKYESKRAALAPPQPESFDLQIQQDKDPHYRVLDLARGAITTNWTTSYFHKSLSGYHAAKLQRYQEVIDSFLGKDLNRSLHIVGMLNGKYIIGQNGEVIQNPQACGHAWFVREIKVVPNAEAEMAAMRDFDPKTTAVVQQPYAGELENLNLQPDSNATIDLVSYHPERMNYEYSSQTEAFAVFPEIYYPPAKGWKCYLNGEPAPDFTKVNYLLRGMRLPAGQNMKLEMRFEPQSYYVGKKVGMGVSALIMVSLLAGLFLFYREQRDLPPAAGDHSSKDKSGHSQEPSKRADRAAAPKRKRKS